MRTVGGRTRNAKRNACSQPCTQPPGCASLTMALQRRYSTDVHSNMYMRTTVLGYCTCTYGGYVLYRTSVPMYYYPVHMYSVGIPTVGLPTVPCVTYLRYSCTSTCTRSSTYDIMRPDGVDLAEAASYLAEACSACVDVLLQLHFHALNFTLSLLHTVKFCVHDRCRDCTFQSLHGEAKEL